MARIHSIGTTKSATLRIVRTFAFGEGYLWAISIILAGSLSILVLDTRIALHLHYLHNSSGCQQPERVGLGRIASLRAKTTRARISSHNPEVDSSNLSPATKYAADHFGRRRFCLGFRIGTHNSQVTGSNRVTLASPSYYFEASGFHALSASFDLAIRSHALASHHRNRMARSRGSSLGTFGHTVHRVEPCGQRLTRCVRTTVTTGVSHFNQARPHTCTCAPVQVSGDNATDTGANSVTASGAEGGQGDCVAGVEPAAPRLPSGCRMGRCWRKMRTDERCSQHTELAADERCDHKFLAHRVSWLNMTVYLPEGCRFRGVWRVYHGQLAPEIRADERCSQHRAFETILDKPMRVVALGGKLL